MSQQLIALSPAQHGGLTAWRWTGIAFVYWLVFMAVLEPGNLAGIRDAGLEPDWGLEALRLVGAGLLGASVTPILLELARRFPIERRPRVQGLAWQALAVLFLAPTLIVVSCLLAAWLLAGEAAPSLADIQGQLAANTLLLVFCLSLLLGLIHVARRLRPVVEDAGSAWLDRLTIRQRGRLSVLDLADVEWIETQGNYQALHTAGAAHLIRETSAHLAARLDPSRFVRIHRRIIVAADRVRRIEPLPNGDAVVRLANGAELRLSRSHREALRRRLDALGPTPEPG